ncbi:MAG: hypothetical protein WBF90_22310 [Rivularia sp. (in: cyanobacteria)]
MEFGNGWSLATDELGVFMPMPNAQCPMPNALCPMPNAQCPIPYLFKS